jgi:hypothetical protein
MPKKYIRIDIHSVDDLPKAKGLYYSFAVDEDENLEPEMVIGEYDPENSECVKEWTKFCKWYLIEEPSEAQREELRNELIKYASRYDKYNMDNIRTADIPAMLELYRKGHEQSVDLYLKTK